MKHLPVAFVLLSCLTLLQPLTAEEDKTQTLPKESTKDRKIRHKKVAKRRQGLVLMVHRGATRIAPENTLMAYRAAVERGADGCEIDIRKTKDGVLVLFHDPSVKRMLQGEGTIRDLTLAQLRKIRFRGNNSKVPTFVEFLRLARKQAMLIHLDVKVPGVQDRIIKLLDKADMWDHIVEVNAGNADRIRNHQKVKLLRYKGWYPHPKPSDERLQKFLASPGEMVFLKWDPKAIAARLRKAQKTIEACSVHEASDQPVEK
ncbi:MAG: glycerophosphodiester phosphodiesterase [Gemmataceae bacterium]